MKLFNGGREVGVVSCGCQYTKWVGPVNIGALLLFPGHLISLTGDVEWPAQSPDLSSCDVFLWAYLKEKVFKHCP